MLPFDVEYYLRRAIANPNAMHSDLAPAMPWCIARMVAELLARISNVPGGLSCTLSYQLRAKLASKVLFGRGVTRSALGLALRGMKLACARARVQAGEAVGIIAAQSPGEITTQETLNTFHFAGVSAGRATTQGLPRFREILGATEHPHTPMIRAPLLEGVDPRSVQRRLDHLRVGDIVLGCTWSPAMVADAYPLGVLHVKWLAPGDVSANPCTTVRIALDRAALRSRAFASEDGTAVDPVCFVAWQIEQHARCFSSAIQGLSPTSTPARASRSCR
ncbi:hypothetical protein T492DRAFT_1045466 [Pavlovales sp. CCMP2436]|nr:hypothetical protein T492DRAFT_1045466 [Pavlovales sp. CCMP2436]|mmetsp:Transcript_24848/g.62902  ORF Transcript_24848/g.62902 Transcript_24848/m.62902 type:complete len:276 (+) Transcript_24848:97-924(+)